MPSKRESEYSEEFINGSPAPSYSAIIQPMAKLEEFFSFPLRLFCRKIPEKINITRKLGVDMPRMRFTLINFLQPSNVRQISATKNKISNLRWNRYMMRWYWGPSGRIYFTLIPPSNSSRRIFWVLASVMCLILKSIKYSPKFCGM